MADGFIVIPLGDASVGRAELRELAHELQEVLAERMTLTPLLPFVSHWLDHPIVCESVARHLVDRGHTAPVCEVCP